MLKLIPFAVALLLAGRPQAGPPSTGLPTGADFPAADRPLWADVHREAASSLAARRLVEAPDSPETVRILATAKKLDDLLVVLRRIVDTQPSRIPDAFDAAALALWEFRGDSTRVSEQKDVLRRIVTDARPKLAELPREDAARAERAFIIVDSHVSSDRNSYRPALQRFVEQYRGTEAALLTEVDVISNGGVSQQMLDALDAFVRAHPGTTAAAKALYQLGFQWHTINVLGTIEPRDADPTSRFFRVLDIVKELESGRYPRSEWTEKAPSLIWQFFFPDKVKIAPDNLDRLLAAVEDFAATHFDLSTDFPGGSAMVYFLTSRLGELYERKGDRTAGVEAAFSRLERRVADSASVRFVRASFYLQAPRTESPEERGTRLAKARRLLGAVSNEGRALVHRQALATLATMDFTDGNYADARASFRRYIRAYPDSNWAWVASIRAGQCEEALGNAAAAAQMYLAVIPSDAIVPMVRVLGHEYAARAFELAGDFPRALEEHEKALGAWSRDASPVYTTYWRRSPTAVDPFLLPASAGGVARDALVLRTAQLQRLLSVPGGVRLERGRVLLARGRHD